MNELKQFFEDLDRDLDLEEIMDSLEQVCFDGNDIIVTTRP
jgi:hypothetical protein